MTSTTTAVATIPTIDHTEGVRLGEEAYRRLVDDFAALGADDWALPTDCTGWTVRDLGGHLLGNLRAAASVRELTRQQVIAVRRAKADGGGPVDHMTALQIEDAAELSTAELVGELQRMVPKAVAGRRRIPAPMRRWPKVKVEMGSISERWSMGYLVDVILTRDAWLHRVDLARAVGRQLELDPSHDGRIVADIAAEWARRHGQPVELVLTGPAGGTFVQATGGPRLELDAVEFCRIVSGRAEGTGLLATEVPF